MTDLLRDRDERVSLAATWALRKIGPDAIPGIARLLRNQDPAVRYRAAGALMAVVGELTDAAPAVRDEVSAELLELLELGAENSAGSQVVIIFRLHKHHRNRRLSDCSDQSAA